MKTIAIMQPYLFPYLGYFQLIQAVDDFIFFDDVNYIKKGWINRNNILANGQPSLFTVPIIKASQNKKICDSYPLITDSWTEKFVNSLTQAYSKAPFFNESCSLVQKVFKSIDPKNSIADLAIQSIKSVLEYIDLEKSIMLSSEISYNREGSGPEKIISITKNLGAQHYVNPINGRELYSSEYFDDHGIKLSFIQMEEHLKYNQLNNSFIPNLSILDVLMYNSPEGIRQLLTKYTLLDG
ncbi:MAG: WbqC family protein [Reichenbachiella sp.]|uniref:WbqC family protein n=1 Tax=Reichenbachiella sp. TaxID=2184521 RepID=UPI003263C11A